MAYVSDCTYDPRHAGGVRLVPDRCIESQPKELIMASLFERTEARAAEIGGGLIVRRALPNRARRMVGAWCFLDHAGPLEFEAGGGLRVGPHPHIGLQTFTWMIEGAVMHRDSLGNEQLITPGQVNLMTAGGGIAHSEDSTGTRVHAVQLWIALPESERRRAPAFRNHPELPRIELEGFDVRVLAGSVLGRTSPVEVYTPLIGLDLSASARAGLTLPLTAAYEHAVLALSGAVSISGESLLPGTLLYLGTGRDVLRLECESAARMILIGGAPFGEEILLWWNFVARRTEEIEEATQDWNAGRRFGVVRGSPSPPLIAPSVGGLHLRTPGA
jgi:quercetin 2,3-dioxygenase